MNKLGLSEDIIEICAQLDKTLDHLGRARIELLKISKIIRNPQISQAVSAAFRAYSAVEVIRLEMGQAINRAQQLPLEGCEEQEP